MNLALTMAQDDNRRKTWNIYADSQAVIQAINKPWRQSGQFIIKEFLNTVNETTKNNSHLQISIT